MQLNNSGVNVFCICSGDFKEAKRVFGLNKWRLNTMHLSKTPGGFIKLEKNHNYMFINLTRQEYGYTDTPDFPVMDMKVEVTLTLNDPVRRS